MEITCYGCLYVFTFSTKDIIKFRFWKICKPSKPLTLIKVTRDIHTYTNKHTYDLIVSAGEGQVLIKCCSIFLVPFSPTCFKLVGI